jgi:TolB-like protein
LSQIAKELDVDRLLEGAVVESPERVRITVRLLDATDRVLWAETYDRKIADILALQGKLATTIVEQVLRHSAGR